MTALFQLTLYGILLGFGATALSDLWALFQQRVLGMQVPNWALVGRWFAYLPRGQWLHPSIAKTPPVPGEGLIGWTAHYLIGMGYGVLLLAFTGLAWLDQPTLLPALAVGIATLLAPFLILQPGMGAGLAARKTPSPTKARLRSLLNHCVFGLCLYLAARVWHLLG
ncbi:DUF2938 domain-containing protein [Pseudomonas putida]|uniref:DUF2938 domain-containing protein n=1 Tax=Pseudomonas putida TaxID=303 RepID=UPI0023642198|nr:DUF2938 domain-containing protein [Pseudomonas putida]MDD2054431.1 DUF2938 domain-containing protein [Pseudomonas putida]